MKRWGVEGGLVWGGGVARAALGGIGLSKEGGAAERDLPLSLMPSSFDATYNGKRHTTQTVPEENMYAGKDLQPHHIHPSFHKPAIMHLSFPS